MNTKKTFNDFKEGELIFHRISKTITESDNNLFCLLTMNHNPIHLNAEYAQYSEFGKILVVGTLVFSLVVGMSVQDISFNAINLGYDKIKHLQPVFIGDTIHARTMILSKRISKKGKGIVKVLTTGCVSGKDVIEFNRTILC